MVCATENPNFRAASCCKVDVVKGAAGVLFPGFVSTDEIVNDAFLASFKKASASCSFANRLSNSALKFPFSLAK